MDIKTFIRKTFIVLLSIFIILNVFGLILDYQLRLSNVFKVNILFNKKLPENLILGSSRSLTGINTELLSKLTKKQWYNLSMDDTKTETHLLFFNLLVSLNKIPKCALLQYDRQNLNLDSFKFFDNDYQFLPFLNTNQIIDDYFCSKPNYVFFKYLPIYKYVYFNTELLFPSILSIFNSGYHHKFIEKTGDYDYPNDYTMKYSKTKFGKRSIHLKNSLVDSCVSICNKCNIQLYIYTAPIYHVHTNTDRTMNNYFDFSDIYLNAEQFSDDFHIAHKTKNDFTTKLSKIFNTTY